MRVISLQVLSFESMRVCTEISSKNSNTCGGHTPGLSRIQAWTWVNLTLLNVIFVWNHVYVWTPFKGVLSIVLPPLVSLPTPRLKYFSIQFYRWYYERIHQPKLERNTSRTKPVAGRDYRTNFIICRQRFPRTIRHGRLIPQLVSFIWKKTAASPFAFHNNDKFVLVFTHTSVFACMKLVISVSLTIYYSIFIL